LLTPAFDITKRPDGLFDHSIIVRLKETVDFTISACGNEVIGIRAFVYPAGLVSVTDQHQVISGCWSRTYQNAQPGRWKIDISTVNAESDFVFDTKLE
jgi:hypothetical protein